MPPSGQPCPMPTSTDHGNCTRRCSTTSLRSARPWPGRRKFRFKNKLFSLDASVIELCASLFDWATFRQTKGAVKLHLLLDHDGYLPVFAHITEGMSMRSTLHRVSPFRKDPSWRAIGATPTMPCLPGGTRKGSSSSPGRRTMPLTRWSRKGRFPRTGIF